MIDAMPPPPPESRRCGQKRRRMVDLATKLFDERANFERAGTNYVDDSRAEPSTHRILDHIENVCEPDGIDPLPAQSTPIPLKCALHLLDQWTWIVRRPIDLARPNHRRIPTMGHDFGVQRPQSSQMPGLLRVCAA